MSTTIPAILGFGFLASEAGLAIRRRASGTGTDGKSADAGSLRLLWIVTSSAFTVGSILAVNDVGPWLPAGLPWQWVGLGVFVAGAVLRWWAVWHLGRFFTVNVSLAADHRVVDNGPYRLIRHPSYTGLLLQYTGYGLTLVSVPGLLLVTIPPTLALLYRIRVEETALRAHLGEAYAAYVRRTKRLVPMVY